MRRLLFVLAPAAAAVTALTGVSVASASSNHVPKTDVRNEAVVAQTDLPLIVNTWAVECFQAATEVAWMTLSSNEGGRVQALIDGCSSAERSQCDGSVGYGSHPDETGETTLDALVMDGPGHRMGAVGDLRMVKDAIAVASAVMNYTKHSFLVGESATRFAREMGFHVTDLHTEDSWRDWQQWINARCQPNYRINVEPAANNSCGPYKPKPLGHIVEQQKDRDNELGRPGNHDTIGMIVIDNNKDVAVGTSTNGAGHKVPGRVGDSPIPGAGAYVDNDVGGAASTGDGDVMMRTLPSYQAVESMRAGKSPDEACDEAIARIKRHFPSFSGAVVAANKHGEHGAGCHNLGTFTYSFRNARSTRVQTRTVSCS